ncbi:UNVERIFIED_CONTAM: hypothetical protein K2H54_001261 [Gekko kuhli]
MGAGGRLHGEPEWAMPRRQVRKPGLVEEEAESPRQIFHLPPLMQPSKGSRLLSNCLMLCGSCRNPSPFPSIVYSVFTINDCALSTQTVLGFHWDWFSVLPFRPTRVSKATNIKMVKHVNIKTAFPVIYLSVCLF